MTCKLIQGVFWIAFSINVAAGESVDLPPQDVLSIVPASELPGGMPPEFQASRRKQLITKDVDGVSHVGEDAALAEGIENAVAAIERVRAHSRIKGVARAIRDERLPGLVFDIDDIPLTMPAVSMTQGVLVGAKPAGTLIGERWTGLTRYLRLDDGALVELTETDLASVQGRLYLVPEAINTEINGKPAVAAVLKNASGRSVRQVIWVNGPKSFELNVLEAAPPKSRDAALKQAQDTKPPVNAIEMARSLKQP